MSVSKSDSISKLTIFDIPLEIIEEILKNVDYLSKMSFIFTSKIFYQEKDNLFKIEKLPKNRCKNNQRVKIKSINYLQKYKYINEEHFLDQYGCGRTREIYYENIKSFLKTKIKDDINLDFNIFYLVKLKESNHVNGNYNYYVIITKKFAILFDGKYLKVSYNTYPRYLKCKRIVIKNISYFDDNFIYTKDEDVYDIHSLLHLEKYMTDIDKLVFKTNDFLGISTILFVFFRKNNKLNCIGKYIKHYSFPNTGISWDKFEFIDRKLIPYNMRRKARKAFLRLVDILKINTVSKYIDMINFD